MFLHREKRPPPTWNKVFSRNVLWGKARKKMKIPFLVTKGCQNSKSISFSKTLDVICVTFHHYFSRQLTLKGSRAKTEKLKNDKIYFLVTKSGQNLNLMTFLMILEFTIFTWQDLQKIVPKHEWEKIFEVDPRLFHNFRGENRSIVFRNPNFFPDFEWKKGFLNFFSTRGSSFC